MKDSSSATERVGRYQLLEPIGGGANGEVWRAKVFGVAGFERQFAIKRFLPELTASASAAQALSAAARSYGGLEHPRIARMSEFGVVQGVTFTAVEMVAGLDAMRLVAESKLNGTGLAIGGALALISQAARAVGYAHGRGLSHLGLSPSNIIVTVEGDVKVTDFGILASTITARPVDNLRLAQRIGYLAPEQLAGETTSAATDVYVLGVIAYELVTGQRAFFGDTPQALAQAILAGPPAEPPLPRPIVRVLGRCLARSQFERFPDARAFADALDAALRVAPVPGTRKDIGGQVKATLERHATMNEGNLSGMVALNVGTFRPPASQSPPEPHEGVQTTEFVRPDVPVAGPAPLVGPRDVSPAATVPDLQRTTTTVPGLVVPPPIPVPPGISMPQPPPIPPAPSTAIAPQTILGMPTAKRSPMPAVIAQIKPAATGPKPVESRVGLVGLERGSGLSDARGGLGADRVPPSDVLGGGRPSGGSASDATLADAPLSDSLDASLDAVFGSSDEPPTKPFEVLDEPVRGMRPGAAGSRELPRAVTDTSPLIEFIHEPTEADTEIAKPASRPAASTPPPKREAPTGEMNPVLVRELNRAAKLSTNELPAVVEQAFEQHPRGAPEVPSIAPTIARGASVSPPSTRMPSPSPPSLVPPVVHFGSGSSNPGSTNPSLAPPPPRSYLKPNAPRVHPTAAAPTLRTAARWPWILGVLLIAGAGIGVFVWQMKKAGDDSNVTVAADHHGKKGSGSSGSRTSGSGTSVVGTSGSGTSGSGTSVVGTSGSGTSVVGTFGSGTSVVGTSGSGTSKAHAEPTGSSDALQVSSTPAGARVFIDGADQGVTPVKISGSADRHTMALLLAGHELYVAEVDGHGAFSIQLKAVTPPGGAAGIKVIKCKDKDRYYVSVDGKPTGMTCPTERIECELGSHTVEVYDIVTETRRTWDIKVTDTRLSYRVRVD